MKEDSAWHLDRRIPAALIMTIAGQTAAVVWFLASMEARVGVLEGSALKMDKMAMAIHQIEKNEIGTDAQLRAILALVQRIEQQMNGR